MVAALVALMGCAEAGLVPGGDEAIDLVPVFSVDSTAAAGAKLFMPTTLTQADLMYTVFAPPLVRFDSAPAGFAVGKAHTVSLLGTNVSLVTTKSGSVVTFTGTIMETASDDSEVETGRIVINYDKKAQTFSYRSELLVSLHNITSNWDNFNCYLVSEIPETPIAEDHSFIARYSATAFLGMVPDPYEFQWFDAGELYSGPGDAGEWIVGYAGATFSDTGEDGLNAITLADEAHFAVMTEDGIPFPDATFRPIREAVVAAHEELKSLKLDNGAPMVGYKAINSVGTVTKNVVYNGLEPYLGQLYMPDMDYDNGGDGWDPVDFENGTMKTSDGDLIGFIPDPSNSSAIKHCQANLSSFISGFPASAWRNNTAFRSIYSDWTP